MRRDVPLRRSLLVKLLLLSALVSACSIAATAWLSVRTTAVAIRQEQGQALADDARIYDALLGYAATHPDWSGAGSTVRRLAQQSGHRITVTDENRQPIVDSALPAAAARSALPSEALATVDPLAVNTALGGRQPANPLPPAAIPMEAAPAPAPCPPDHRCDTAVRPAQQLPGPESDHIDPRATGPFRLPLAERKTLQTAALRSAECLRVRRHIDATIVDQPSGRPRIEAPQLDALSADCISSVLGEPTPTEAKALAQLNSLVNTCLTRRNAPRVTLMLDLSWYQQSAAENGPSGSKLVTSCISTSRSEQLAPYVAPPALLFVSSPTRSASTFLDLSPANRTRIAEVAALVLLGTMTVTTLAGLRMVRPLRALTGAARRMTGGDLSARVKVRTGDEIGRVGTAFNDMSARRQQLEELRKAMVSDVAHELRTPLSNIRGWLEAAEDGLVVPDQALLSSLLAEALLLQHVIDDLRDLSAADAGELRLHREWLDIPDLLDQVATAHRGNAEAVGVALLTSSEGRPEAVADPVRLRQAVGNLVSNAVRHTPPGGSVTLRSRLEGRHVVIDVTDTGTGIGPTDLPRVFDRFWRAEKSRNRQTGGSGLGLAIVRKLAEAHGGSASAASVRGDGSVFTLRIPSEPGPPPGDGAESAGPR